MALKGLLTKAEFDALADPLKVGYKAQGDSYVVDVDGFVSKTELESANARLTEFRDNNRTLNAAIEKLKTTFGVQGVDDVVAKFKDIDPTKVATMAAELEKLKGKGVTDADKLEAVISAAADKLLTPIRQELQTEKLERAKAQDALKTSTLRAKIADVALKHGARKNAVDVIVEKALSVFELADGDRIVAKDGQYSKDKPAEKITPEEWLTQASKGPLDYAFEGSTGTGATPQNGGPQPPARTLTNPDARTFAANLEDIAKGKVAVATA
jgi:hypothetical protein